MSNFPPTFPALPEFEVLLPTNMIDNPADVLPNPFFSLTEDSITLKVPTENMEFPACELRQKAANMWTPESTKFNRLQVELQVIEPQPLVGVSLARVDWTASEENRTPAIELVWISHADNGSYGDLYLFTREYKGRDVKIELLAAGVPAEKPLQVVVELASDYRFKLKVMNTLFTQDLLYEGLLNRQTYKNSHLSFAVGARMKDRLEAHDGLLVVSVTALGTYHGSEEDESVLFYVPPVVAEEPAAKPSRKKRAAK